MNHFILRILFATQILLCLSATNTNIAEASLFRKAPAYLNTTKLEPSDGLGASKQAARKVLRKLAYSVAGLAFSWGIIAADASALSVDQTAACGTYETKKNLRFLFL